MGGMVQSPFQSYGYLDLFDDVMHLHGLIFGRAISYYYKISSRAPPPASPEALERLPRKPMVTYAPPKKAALKETEGIVAGGERKATTATTVPLPVAPERDGVSALVCVVMALLVALYASRRRRVTSGEGHLPAHSHSASLRSV